MNRWLLAVLVVVSLAISRVAVVFVPFRQLAAALGELGVETPYERMADFNKDKRLGHVVRRISRVLPWRCLCFEQALAASMILKVFGRSGTINFGLATEDGELSAHAWLRCGDQIITGAHGHERFTVVFNVAFNRMLINQSSGNTITRKCK